MKPASAKPADIASASVPNPLTVFQVNPDTEFTHAEVDIRRKEHGCMASVQSAMIRKPAHGKLHDAETRANPKSPKAVG